MYILGIDSSTKIMSISLSQNGNLVNELEDANSQGFIVDIISVIDKVLSKPKINLKDIDFYCVNKGPGDFTGTRIGISVAKMLSWVDKKPIFGINAPDVFAAEIAFNNKEIIQKFLQDYQSVFILPLLDVKRNDLYLSLFKILMNEELKGDKFDYFQNIAEFHIKDKTYNICRVSGYLLLSKDNFLKSLINFFVKEDSLGHSEASNLKSLAKLFSIIVSKKSKIIFGGSAFESYKDLSREIEDLDMTMNKGKTSNSGKLFIIDEKSNFPAARYLNLCAYYNAFYANKPGDTSILPVYVRDFAAFQNRL